MSLKITVHQGQSGKLEVIAVCCSLHISRPRGVLRVLTRGVQEEKAVVLCSTLGGPHTAAPAYGVACPQSSEAEQHRRRHADWPMRCMPQDSHPQGVVFCPYRSLQVFIHRVCFSSIDGKY